MRWSVAALAMAMGAALLPDVARAGEGVEVTASVLNVRAGPGTDRPVLGQIRAGQVYPLLQRSGSWVRLQMGAQAGWSHGGYLRAVAADIRSVTASSLNVRSGPSTSYRVLGQLPGGARVAVAGQQGAWRRIAFEGRDAWVHGDHLAVAGTVAPPVTAGGTRPTSRAGYIQLAASGPGFYGYTVASRRWGTPRFIYGIERIARRWSSERPGTPRIGVGDISAENGGYLSGHASHRLGVDADFLPVRNDGREARVTIHDAAYSRALTRALLLMFEAELAVTHIFFNDSGISTPHRQYWRNHDNHFHVRVTR